MVHVLDGNSGLGAHGVFCLRHLIRSIAGANWNFFLQTCTACTELPSNISTMKGEGEVSCLIRLGSFFICNVSPSFFFSVGVDGGGGGAMLPSFKWSNKNGHNSFFSGSGQGSCAQLY